MTQQPKSEQCLCPSYYDDDNVLQDCTCGKCEEQPKREWEEILSELFDAGKRYGEDIGYAKDDALYEHRSEALLEAKNKLENIVFSAKSQVLEEYKKSLDKDSNEQN